MYCRKCGHRNLDDSNFCSNCGTKLIIEENIDDYEYSPENNVKNINLDKKVKENYYDKYKKNMDLNVKPNVNLNINKNKNSNKESITKIEDIENTVVYNNKNINTIEDLNTIEGINSNGNFGTDENHLKKSKFSFFKKKKNKENNIKDTNIKENIDENLIDEKYTDNDVIDFEDEDDDIVDRDEVKETSSKGSLFKRIMMVIFLLLIAVGGFLSIKFVEKNTNEKKELIEIESMTPSKNNEDYKKAIELYVAKLNEQHKNYSETIKKLSILKGKNKILDKNKFNGWIQSGINRINGLKYYDNIPSTQNKIEKVKNKLINPPNDYYGTYESSMTLSEESKKISDIFTQHVEDYSREELIELVNEFKTNIDIFEEIIQ